MKKLFLLATAPLLFIEACTLLQVSDKKENKISIEIHQPVLLETKARNGTVSLVVWDNGNGGDVLINSGTINTRPPANYQYRPEVLSRIKTENVIEIIN